MISISTAKGHQKIGHIFYENAHIFSKTNEDYEQLTLTVFIMYEYQFGKDSFWYPYINLMPDVEFFCNWADKDLE